MKKNSRVRIVSSFGSNKSIHQNSLDIFIYCETAGKKNRLTDSVSKDKLIWGSGRRGLGVVSQAAGLLLQDWQYQQAAGGSEPCRGRGKNGGRFPSSAELVVVIRGGMNQGRRLRSAIMTSPISGSVSEKGKKP